MEKVYRYFAIFLIILSAQGCSLKQEREVIYQTSVIGALMQGVYDGEVSIAELKQQGDLGLGTFNALDGEMVVVDGRVFQVKYDGSVVEAADSMKTPFAVVTFFDADQTLELVDVPDMNQLKVSIDQTLPTPNILYAVRIDGDFEYVKTRSVPRQSPPYPALTDVVKDQSIFEFHDVQGTIVGFRSPQYIKGINVPAYHLHFITDDRGAGGHLLECKVKRADVMLDITPGLFLNIPQDRAFYEVPLGDDLQHQLERVEK